MGRVLGRESEAEGLEDGSPPAGSRLEPLMEVWGLRPKR
jgi:hypothetical protein